MRCPTGSTRGNVGDSKEHVSHIRVITGCLVAYTQAVPSHTLWGWCVLSCAGLVICSKKLWNGSRENWSDFNANMQELWIYIVKQANKLQIHIFIGIFDGRGKEKKNGRDQYFIAGVRLRYMSHFGTRDKKKKKQKHFHF